jgi:hypothetical protein
MVEQLELRDRQILGPIMVHLGVQRLPLRGFGEPSVSRSFNQLPVLAVLSRQRSRVRVSSSPPFTLEHLR